MTMCVVLHVCVCVFVQYVHLPNFDVASDAFVTLRDLLTRHKTVASDVSFCALTRWFVFSFFFVS